MDLLSRLRQRLVTVPKPGTEPRTLGPGEWLTCTIGGKHKAGDDAGEQTLPNYTSMASGIMASGYQPPWRVQPHVYAVEPICEEAAQEIERLETEVAQCHAIIREEIAAHEAVRLRAALQGLVDEVKSYPGERLAETAHFAVGLLVADSLLKRPADSAEGNDHAK